ncbi:hypothetical protein PLICRDRAFT_698972 [Plicaturopsis crispa FD-325 SS-3]|nr:hypothetical protein PLICRDRAFT_698972 [Plicaturopsis crispa FD-325 SS-3]
MLSSWYWLAGCSLHVLAAARIHSLPEDTYAFPKYGVSFLNGQPVDEDTAHRWLQHGLRGGELEFLDQPWSSDGARTAQSLKEIGGADGQTVLSAEPRYRLEHMKLGPKAAYICFVPPPLETPPEEEDNDANLTPALGWSLLQPLSGTCLYHRQGWFTYSYCHNQEIRQFRELPLSHLPAGGYQPEEDPDWESYTLGRAPPTPEPGAELTVAEQTALAANLELARGAGSRYLVQRWGDGSICDKNGRKREVEVQFHCSMTMTDTILFVKEAKTCSYVLVVHTPRLCAAPGFKSRLDAREEARIRCREIVPHAAVGGQGELPESDHPVRLPKKAVLPGKEGGLPAKEASPPTEEKEGKGKEEDGKKEGKDDTKKIKGTGADALRRALSALMGREDGAVVVELDPSDFAEFGLEEEEFVIGTEGFISPELAAALSKAGLPVRDGGEDVDGEEGEEDGKDRKEEGDGVRAAAQRGNL